MKGVWRETEAVSGNDITVFEFQEIPVRVDSGSTFAGFNTFVNSLSHMDSLSQSSMLFFLSYSSARLLPIHPGLNSVSFLHAMKPSHIVTARMQMLLYITLTYQYSGRRRATLSSSNLALPTRYSSSFPLSACFKCQITLDHNDNLFILFPSIRKFECRLTLRKSSCG